MFATLQNLLVAANATGPGNPVALAPEMTRKPLGLEVFGTFVGTVILEGTIATQAEVNGATASWAAIPTASWTTPALANLTTPYTHVRANVTAYTSGAINVRAV